MQALKASAVGFHAAVTSLPTQDGVGQLSPLLQFTSFYWEVISACCWASASAHETPPLLYPNTTKGRSRWPHESPVTCCTTAQLQRGRAPALLAPGEGLVPRALSGGTGQNPSA